MDRQGEAAPSELVKVVVVGKEKKEGDLSMAFGKCASAILCTAF
jgi:hypothetical protein